MAAFFDSDCHSSWCSRRRCRSEKEAAADPQRSLINESQSWKTSLLQAKATRPQYDRDSLKARIVHLGFGAFHRRTRRCTPIYSPQNRAATGGYCEVNLIGGEQQIADLKAQDNLYTVAEMSADAWTARVVGVVKKRCMRRSTGWKPCWRRCASHRSPLFP